MSGKKGSNRPPPVGFPAPTSPPILVGDFPLLARAFNEWMRRYTEEPERFQAEYAAVKRYLTQAGLGEEPSYGQEALTYLLRLAAELG